MPTWVGPTAALSLLVIALCFLGIAIAALYALREGVERGQSLAKELGELRRLVFEHRILFQEKWNEHFSR